jgi:hypothetical protein
MNNAAEDAWQAILDAGVEAFQQADFPRAETLFQQAMAEGREGMPKNWLLHVWSFDYLMLAYQAQAKDPQMGELREQARAISADLARQAAMARQAARTGHELEAAMSLEMGADFYRRRAYWRGKGAAEYFARTWPLLSQEDVQDRVVWVGKSGAHHEAFLDVGSGPGWVLLTLSGFLENEAQISLRPEECESLIASLQQALAHATGSEPRG